MNKKTSKVILLFYLVLSTFVFSACAEDNGDETVQLGYVNWAEGVAMNYLVHAVLEDEMGYQVESTMADVGSIFSLLSSGDFDAFVDAWLPFTHKDYMMEHGENIDDLGYNFEGARIGLVVPDYVNIESINELNEAADEFDFEIIGIGSSAGIMSATENAIDIYGLEFTLIETSDPIMVATLRQAIEEGEWVVVTGWEPHWKFSEWDIKFLNDPEGVYGSIENIHTISRQDLSADMPDVAEFLQNFNMDNEQLGDLMGVIEEQQENMDVLEIVRNWMGNNRVLIESWLPED